jgi:hypothetical protein
MGKKRKGSAVNYRSFAIPSLNYTPIYFTEQKKIFEGHPGQILLFLRGPRKVFLATFKNILEK